MGCKIMENGEAPSLAIPNIKGEKKRYLRVIRGVFLRWVLLLFLYRSPNLKG